MICSIIIGCVCVVSTVSQITGSVKAKNRAIEVLKMVDRSSKYNLVDEFLNAKTPADKIKASSNIYAFLFGVLPLAETKYLTGFTDDSISARINYTHSLLEGIDSV